MIQNTLSGIGMTGRDQAIEDDFGWVDQVFLQDAYVMLRYPLARRVVTDSADNITEAGIHVSASGVSGDKIDDLEKYIESHTKINSLHESLTNAMAFGLGAEILVVDDGRKPWEPVDEANIRDVIAVVPSHRWELTPWAWGGSMVVRGPDGRPTVNQQYQREQVYSYTPWMYGSDMSGRGGDWLEGPGGDPWTMPSANMIQNGTRIHASRICAYPGIPLPQILQRDNGGYPDPILRQCRRPILAWYGHVHHAGDAGRHLSELVYTGDRLTQAIDMPMSGVRTPEQAQAYLANMISNQQITSSYKGVRLLQDGETLEYLAKPLSGFEQLTQVIMIDCALSAGIPLENLFMVSPPGGIGAAGAGRFIWDNYAATTRRRFDGYVSPARAKIYRYAALAKNGPIAATVPMRLELGSLTSETQLERAQRKLAEYQALEVAQLNSWVDSREVRAREKQTRDDFITLEDQYDADLQKPGALDLSGMAGGLGGGEAPAGEARTDAAWKEDAHPRAEDGKFGEGDGCGGEGLDVSGNVEDVAWRFAEQSGGKFGDIADILESKKTSGEKVTALKDLLGESFGKLSAVPKSKDTTPDAVPDTSTSSSAPKPAQDVYKKSPELAELMEHVRYHIGLDQYDSLGVRRVNKTPRAKNPPKVKPGQELPESHRWADDKATQEKLGGTSTTGIKINDGPDDATLEARVKSALELNLKNYGPPGHFVLVGGEGAYDGQDPGESVISRAKVLARWDADEIMVPDLKGD